jgi:hypothetical protein
MKLLLFYFSVRKGPGDVEGKSVGAFFELSSLY